MFSYQIWHSNEPLPETERDRRKFYDALPGCNVVFCVMGDVKHTFLCNTKHGDGPSHALGLRVSEKLHSATP